MKTWMKMLSVVLVVMLAWAVCACAAADGVFAFDQLSYEVNAGKTIKLTPILQGAEAPKGAKYVWDSSDKTVATVQNGTVTGKGGGTAVITCQMQDGKQNVLYETCCEVVVLQGIKQLKPESDKPLEMVISVSGGKKYTHQLMPKIFPESATNKKLTFTSSDTSLAYVSEDGLVTTGSKYQSGGIVTITIEATDGSGAKTTQKIKCQPFVITETEVEMTERQAYRMHVPVSVDMNLMEFWLPCLKLNAAGVRLENVRKESGEIIPKKVESDATTWFDVRPLKPGTYTLTVYSWPYFWNASCKYTIKLKVTEDAAYGEKAFPTMNYANVSKDPAAVTGQQVRVKGTLLDLYEEGGSWHYVVATKGTNENKVIVRAPAGQKQVEVLKGEKVEACGVYAAPVEEKTATGLTLYNILVDAELINNDCYNTRVTDVQLYQPEETV